MDYLKMLGLAAVAAMAFTAFAVSSASATTLEVGGVTKNESITITASLKAGTSALFTRTDGGYVNTCTLSQIHLRTTTFTGTKVTGPLTGHTAHDKSTGQKPSDGLSFSGCHANLPLPTVHDPGTLYVEHTSGTNGNVFSESLLITVPSTLGFTASCTTGEGVKLGTLTGVKEGNATLDFNAVVNCGFLLPSATWKGEYTVTSPWGLGVSA